MNIKEIPVDFHNDLPNGTIVKLKLYELFEIGVIIDINRTYADEQSRSGRMGSLRYLVHYPGRSPTWTPWGYLSAYYTDDSGVL
jgi:hypothetical protein